MSVFFDPQAWQFWLGTIPDACLVVFMAFDFGRWSAGDRS